jgi:hypothetical protein
MTMHFHSVLIATVIAPALVTCYSQDLPAPKVDRVGFPKDYQSAFRQLRAKDSADAKTVIVVYVKAPAASAKCASCHVKAGEAKDFVYGGSGKP